MESDLHKLREKIRQFDAERDWAKFHNYKDLLIALMSEVGELAECYRWLDAEELERIHSDPAKKKQVESEIADIFMFLERIARKSDIDLFEAVERKIENIRKRYPIENIKGKHTNKLEGFKVKE